MAKPPTTPPADPAPVDIFADIEPTYRRNTTIEPAPEVDMEGYDPIADSYALGHYGQLVDLIQVAGHLRDERDPNFDPLDHVPRGYENYAEAFTGAASMAGVQQVKQNIDENIQARLRRGERGTLNTVLSDLWTGVVDPINLVPGTQLRGAGVVGGAIEGGAVLGTLGAGTEVLRTSLDPTATREEAVWGVAGSYVFGAGLGAVVGGVSGKLGRTRGPMPLPVREQAPVSSAFGNRAAPLRGASTNHKGVDLKVAAGTPVFAQRDGRVIRAGPRGNGGWSVTIDYGDNVTATFMHLSRFDVSEGQIVKAGEQVGASGGARGAPGAGNSTGAHLHYELHVNGEAVNPLTYDLNGAGAAAGVAEPRDPAGTVNVVEGFALRDNATVDGRGVRVVIGRTHNGSMATMVSAERAENLIARQAAALEAESRAMDDATPRPPPDMETKTVKVYGTGRNKNKVIRTYEMEVPRVSTKPKEIAPGVESTAPTFSPKEVRANAQRLFDQSDDLEYNLRLYAEENGTEPDLSAVWAMRQEAKDQLDEITFQDGHWVTDEFGEPRWMSPEEIRSPDYDPDMEDLAKMDRAKREQDFDSGEIPDELPFGMSHPGDSMAETGEHMQVDVEAILASFEHKPWTNPRVEGVHAFAEDAFTSPGDWLNFIVLHESEHSVNKRMFDAGESKADYENRINQRAWDDLQAGKGPFTPTDGLLEKIAIGPTPAAQMARLIPDGQAAIHQSYHELASDFTLMLARNLKGGATATGGSVFSRAHRWMALMDDIRHAIRTNYLEYLGKTATGPRLQTEAGIITARLPFVGTARRQGQMSLNEFRKEVGRALAKPNARDLVPEAVTAAQTHIKVMKQFEQADRELGLFQSTRNRKIAADRKLRRADQIEQRINREAAIHETGGNAADEAELVEIVARLRAEAAELLVKADEPVMPHGEENYLHRYWDAGKIKKDFEGAVLALTPGYERAGYSPEAADRAARSAAQKLIAEPDGEMTPGRPGALNHRSIPATNDEVWDFIIQDPEHIAAAYTRRMGAAIEMTRRFGDPGGLDELDSLRADLIMRGYSKADREQALQLWEDARDRIAGGFHGKDPMSLDNRAVRALKNLVNLAAMGKVIYSQTTDMARVIANHPGGAVRTVLSSINGDLANMSRGGIAKEAGEALEIIMARATAHFIESDDALMVAGETAAERALASAQTPFFVANLMSPFTVLMKEWSGMVNAHALIEDSQVLARAVQAGEEAPAKVMKNLARMGISPYDAQLIASMPTEVTPTGLHLANTTAWEGAKGERARDVFLGAIFGGIRRDVPTPGPLDRPAIFDGVFHTKKGRYAALEEVQRLGEQVEDARDVLRGMARLPDDDPAKMAAIENLQGLIGQHNTARRSVGRAGRREMPIASLPFQLHSFAMAAGSKVTHGLLSGADRNRATTIFAMLAAGAVATWLKSDDSQWDNMGWGELILRSVDSSSIGAWMVDLIKNADSGTGAYLLGDDGVVGAGLTYDDKDKLADNISSLGGAGPGMIANLIEPMVNDALPWNTKVGMVRRSLPFNNLIWWDRITDTLEKQVKEKSPANFDTAATEDMRLDDPRGNMPRALLGQPERDTQGAERNKPLGTSVPIAALPVGKAKKKGRIGRVTVPVLY